MIKLGVDDLARGSFNRTFMELKFAFQRRLCLVAPRFNRTFMELKFFPKEMERQFINVLIVPLWN